MPEWIWAATIGSLIAVLIGEMSHITKLNKRMRKVEAILDQVVETCRAAQ